MAGLVGAVSVSPATELQEWPPLATRIAADNRVHRRSGLKCPLLGSKRGNCMEMTSTNGKRAQIGRANFRRYRLYGPPGSGSAGRRTVFQLWEKNSAKTSHERKK